MNNEEKILALLEQMNSHMGSMDNRLDKMEGDIHQLQVGLEETRSEMHGRLDRMEGDIHQLQGGLEETRSEMHERLDKVEGDIYQLQGGLEGTRSEMHERFDRLDSSVKYAWEDIAIGEKQLAIHEHIFHAVDLPKRFQSISHS